MKNCNVVYRNAIQERSKRRVVEVSERGRGQVEREDGENKMERRRGREE